MFNSSPPSLKPRHPDLPSHKNQSRREGAAGKSAKLSCATRAETPWLLGLLSRAPEGGGGGARGGAHGGAPGAWQGKEGKSAGRPSRVCVRRNTRQSRHANEQQQTTKSSPEGNTANGHREGRCKGRDERRATPKAPQRRLPPPAAAHGPPAQLGGGGLDPAGTTVIQLSTRDVINSRARTALLTLQMHFAALLVCSSAIVRRGVGGDAAIPPTADGGVDASRPTRATIARATCEWHILPQRIRREGATHVHVPARPRRRGAFRALRGRSRLQRAPIGREIRSAQPENRRQ